MLTIFCKLNDKYIICVLENTILNRPCMKSRWILVEAFSIWRPGEKTFLKRSLGSSNLFFTRSKVLERYTWFSSCIFLVILVIDSCVRSKKIFKIRFLLMIPTIWSRNWNKLAAYLHYSSFVMATREAAITKGKWICSTWF